MIRRCDRGTQKHAESSAAVLDEEVRSGASSWLSVVGKHPALHFRAMLRGIGLATEV